MLHRLHCRAGHYALLIVAWAALCLPNLGAPSLWDIDEGNNSEAAREMWRSGNWIVPTCNYRLRTDKPALLYWLQAAGYSLFGPGEFTARLPSALAALAAILAVYELGRRLFNAAAGLLAGLLLGAAVLFCVAAHFANPDSLLNACSLFALLFFWCDYAAGRDGWSPWSAAAAGLAVLAKGPVGLVLPATAAFLFLLWRGELRRLWSRRLWTGLLVFLAVAAPWYGWVAADTKGVWTKGFFLDHNVGRFTGMMENHGGPFLYYLGVLIAGCAPWCVFFSLTAWYAARQAWPGKNPSPGAGPGDRPAVQFLICWIAVYFVFFSLSATKLPNYILPLYPAVALLTARFLDRWRHGEVRPPAWLVASNLALMALIGVGVAAGLLAAGGVLPVPAPRLRPLPGLEWYAALGRRSWRGRSRPGCRCGSGTAPASSSRRWRRRCCSRPASAPGAVVRWRPGRRRGRWRRRCRRTRRAARCGWRLTPISSPASSSIVNARSPGSKRRGRRWNFCGGRCRPTCSCRSSGGATSRRRHPKRMSCSARDTTCSTDATWWW